MPIYEIRKDALVPVSQTSFQAEGLYERRDIQQLLKAQINVLDDGLMVIAEEFGEWVDSRRRIDLLCLDTNANLVVVELKRTEDGEFMELQAIRYAAMVSAMTFEQAVDTLARYRSRGAPDLGAARADILDHLSWSEPDEDRFADETRIILASADFGRELTTAVLWLRDHGIDVRCIRLRPHKMEDGRVLLDVQPLIPLPETTSFQTQLGAKRQAERHDRTERHELRYAFWTGLLALSAQHTNLFAARRASDGTYIGATSGLAGGTFYYNVKQHSAAISFWLNLPQGVAATKSTFLKLEADKEAIESEFGSALVWNENPAGKWSSVTLDFEGGYRSPADDWPRIQRSIVDAMIRFEHVLRQRLIEIVATQKAKP